MRKILVALVLLTSACATDDPTLCTTDDCPEGQSPEVLLGEAKAAAASAQRLVISCSVSGSWPGGFAVCCSLANTGTNWATTVCADNGGLWWY